MAKKPGTPEQQRTSTRAALFVEWLKVVPDEFAAVQGGPQLAARQRRADELEAAMDSLAPPTDTESVT